jgi:hypothetical protein
VGSPGSTREVSSSRIETSGAPDAALLARRLVSVSSSASEEPAESEKAPGMPHELQISNPSPSPISGTDPPAGATPC